MYEYSIKNELAKFRTGHSDVIHDVCFDFYGKRVATCSADQHIKVWDCNEKNEWTCTANWQAHSGPVWRVRWAHPEFGNVLASCSGDRTVCIWEESYVDAGDNAPGISRSVGTASTWHKIATLADSRANVCDVRFSPRERGLRVAVCSEDGRIRLYEAPDVLNLSQWTVTDDFEACVGGCSCVEWKSSKDDPIVLAVGCLDNTVKLFTFDASYRRWTVLEEYRLHSGIIHDVAWAPNLGRDYHLLASAGRDKKIFIVKFKTVSDGDKRKVTNLNTQELADHNAEVWRVEWNITGTILASSGDDNIVRLWKCDLSGDWRKSSEIHSSTL